MVDYRHASTGSTDLIIRDNGSTVEFWIDCRSASTWFGSGRPWSGRVNGVNVGGSFTWASGGGTRRIAGPWTVSITQQVTFGIGNTQTGGMGGPASFSVTVSRARPAAPYSLSLTRVSDSQHRLDWARNATYTSVVVQRRTDDGVWQQVGVAQGNAFTFTDSSTVADRKYEWRVAGVNASGQSDWTGVATGFTTPAAPTGVTAVRSGSNIVVSASGAPRWASSFEVRDGATVVGTGGLPFTHVAPSPSTPHTYTVRGKVAGLDGAWSAPSNTVQLVAPPNAPVELRPNGSVVASGEPVRLSWRHNAVDSSAQSAAEVFIQLADNLGSTWTATTDQFVDMSSLSEGVHSWRVRTKGAHADWSPWSAVASLTVVDRPGVAVLQPVDEWDSSVVTVDWSWVQAQGRPQSAWRYELLDASLAVRESRTGSGAGTSYTLTTRLSEGVWTVRVQAATGDLWSPWASETFTVEFIPPGAPVLSGVWDEVQGGVLITVDPVSGSDTVFTVERSVDDGATWAEVLGPTPSPDGATMFDPESLSYGDNLYRAIAQTVEGAISATTITVPARSGAIWLSGGPGFALTCRLPLNPQITRNGGRATATKRFAGRTKPVTYKGEALSNVFQVAGVVTDRNAIEPNASPDELMDVVRNEEPLHLLRTPDGDIVYGAVSDVKLGRQSVGGDGDELRPWSAFWGYQFELIEGTI